VKRLILAATLLALAGAQTQTTRAGDREWATAGKVLTGVFAASVISKAFVPGPGYYRAGYAYAAPAYGCSYSYCPPPVVVYVPPPPVVYRAPVCVAPAPVVSFSFGYHGERRYWPRCYRW